MGVATGRTARTGKGDMMCFLTLADEDGVFDVTLFPDLYRRTRRRLTEAGIGPLLIEGTVEDQHGAISVTAERVTPLGQKPRLDQNRRPQEPPDA